MYNWLEDWKQKLGVSPQFRKMIAVEGYSNFFGCHTTQCILKHWERREIECRVPTFPYDMKLLQ